MGEHHDGKPISVAHNPDDQLRGDTLELTNLFAKLSLGNSKNSASASSTATDVSNHHTSRTAGATNSMKRRSPSCLYLQGPSTAAATEPETECRAKRQSFEKDEPTNRCFSSNSPPHSHGALANKNPGHVLRRCSSYACHPPATTTGGGFLVTPFHSPEHANVVTNPVTPPSIGGSSSAFGSPHHPPSLKRCVSDPHPSPAKNISRSFGSEKTKSKKRKTGPLTENNLWWTEVIRDEAEEDHDEAQDDKIPHNADRDGQDEECVEQVSVEWADKRLSLQFRCPCGRGYEVLMVGEKCYYNLC